MASHALVNGIDVDELRAKVEALKKDPELAKFKFRVDNTWLVGGHSQTTVQSFHGVGEEHPHDHQFVLEADEPRVLLGQDEGPNPVEHLLNALVTCLTNSMVYHAAIRGLKIEEIESRVEGELDVRGFMGLDPNVSKGYQRIRVLFQVKSDAPVEQLEECARFSPVYDTLSRGTPVELKIEKV